jgi:hypothetical protein
MLNCNTYLINLFYLLRYLRSIRGEIFYMLFLRINGLEEYFLSQKEVALKTKAHLQYKGTLWSTRAWL